ncbi:hypothetical protein AWZ03_015496, partial [Drosophila navojoa]
GNVALTMRMKDELNREASLRGGPDISKESDRSGGPQSLAPSRTREQKWKRGPEAPCGSTTQKVGAVSAGEGLPDDEQGASRSGGPPAQSIESGRKTQNVGAVSADEGLAVDELGTSRSGEPLAQSTKRGRKKQQKEYVRCPQSARTKDLGKGPEKRPPEVKLVGLEAEDVGEIRSSQSPRS